MTVGELKQILFDVDDNLPVFYLPPDTSLDGVYDIKGALLVEKTTGNHSRFPAM